MDDTITITITKTVARSIHRLIMDFWDAELVEAEEAISKGLGIPTVAEENAKARP